ncbi:uncharacterized protein LOC142059225 isoform X2 [Phalacrocorax aristotelis]|uniref:uncharacterized protein LOC142059225 isoform X2 n=1 Tax=Phalacrocorax aristotelis TaxID=126867 RepID=UPI003F4B9074
MERQRLEPHGGGSRAGDGGGPAEGQLTILPAAGPQPRGPAGEADPTGHSRRPLHDRQREGTALPCHVRGAGAPGPPWRPCLPAGAGGARCLAGPGGRQGRLPRLRPAMVSSCRCGRLAFHIQLPYSFLHFPYVESAIRFTHSKDFCGNCSFYPNTTQEANSTMEVPVTLSPLPKQEGKESETPIHQHNPLHPHHHHEVSSERATDPSGDHEPATHAHHHHGDHGQPHHEGKKQKEGNGH